MHFLCNHLKIFLPNSVIHILTMAGINIILDEFYGECQNKIRAMRVVEVIISIIYYNCVPGNKKLVLTF